jgi:hypothetical protein
MASGQWQVVLGSNQLRVMDEKTGNLCYIILINIKRARLRLKTKKVKNNLKS